jgi:hypothetical protein
MQGNAPETHVVLDAQPRTSHLASLMRAFSYSPLAPRYPRARAFWWYIASYPGIAALESFDRPTLREVNLNMYIIVLANSVVLTPLTQVNKGQVNPGSVNPDQSVNGVNEVNVTGSSLAPQT